MVSLNIITRQYTGISCPKQMGKGILKCGAKRKEKEKAGY